MKRLIIFLFILFSLSEAQTNAVRYDSVSVSLNGVDIDTIYVSFRSRENDKLKIDTTGSIDSDVVKMSHKAYLPQELYLIPDTTEVSAAADADSSAIYWVPLNPETKAFIHSDSTYVIGGTGVAAVTLADNVPFVLSLTRASTDYALVIRQDDLTSPVTKWHLVFVRKM